MDSVRVEFQKINHPYRDLRALLAASLRIGHRAGCRQCPWDSVKAFAPICHSWLISFIKMDKTLFFAGACRAHLSMIFMLNWLKAPISKRRSSASQLLRLLTVVAFMPGLLIIRSHKAFSGVATR